MGLLYLFGTPLVVMWLATRWQWINRISPMSVLYVIGLIVANATPWLHDPTMASLNTTVGNVCVPIAIPLMLMACNLSNLSAGKAAKTFLSGLAALIIVAVAGFFLFKGNGDPRRFAQVAAVSLGIYTGGIPNMGAIARGVGMDAETYLYLTSYDLIATGLYLVFVICFGKSVFRLLLPAATQAAPAKTQADKHPATHHKAEVLLPVGLTLVVAALSYGVSTFFSDDLATPMLILVLTTLSIAATFLPAVRRINQRATDEGRDPRSFQVGLYFVYLFCFSIANACDVRQMDLAGSLNILGYVFFVIFGSLVLQIIFAKLLHIDGDTTLVASVALINSPPFVPLVAALLGNKELVVIGITVGLLGYMVGNYLGIGLFFLLCG